jgi:hypothetical protein
MMKNKLDGTTSFDENDVNWEELAAIGILKDELELNGQLEVLLSGKKTDVISLQLILLGVDVVMDATLQLINNNEEPLLEIIGISPNDFSDN